MAASKISILQTKVASEGPEFEVDATKLPGRDLPSRKVLSTLLDHQREPSGKLMMSLGGQGPPANIPSHRIKAQFKQKNQQPQNQRERSHTKSNRNNTTWPT
jgi:hypothetical protein